MCVPDMQCLARAVAHRARRVAATRGASARRRFVATVHGGKQSSLITAGAVQDNVASEILKKKLLAEIHTNRADLQEIVASIKVRNKFSRWIYFFLDSCLIALYLYESHTQSART